MNIADDLSKAGVAQPHIVANEAVLTAHAIRDRSSAAALYRTGEARLFIVDELRRLANRAALVGHNRVKLQRAAGELPDGPVRTALLAALEDAEEVEQQAGRCSTPAWTESMARKHREFVEKLQAVA
jgi:hypothetical protein